MALWTRVSLLQMKALHFRQEIQLHQTFINYKETSSALLVKMKRINSYLMTIFIVEKIKHDYAGRNKSLVSKDNILPRAYRKEIIGRNE